MTMLARYILLSLVCFLTVTFVDALAAPSISLDKRTYTAGDTIKISATLDELKEGGVVLLQVKSQSDILALDQFSPTSKSWSKSIQAEGPKWTESGTYTVVVSYLGEKSEKSFEFLIQPKEIKEEPKKISPPQAPKIEEPDTKEPEADTQIAKPLISIRGFPDPTKPPNYYYERYKSEVKYKEWFDSVFVGYTPAEVVGYPETHVAGFPDPTKAPQYYIDRYRNESEYRRWFDSQFPGLTIQDIVIPPDKFQNTMPAWIKETAGLWARGQIQDQIFVSAIKHLIENDVIEGAAVGKSQSGSMIPEWVKNNAGWWSEGLVTENDFLFGVEELLKRRIIEV